MSSTYFSILMVMQIKFLSYSCGRRISQLFEKVQQKEIEVVISYMQTG